MKFGIITALMLSLGIVSINTYADPISSTNETKEMQIESKNQRLGAAFLETNKKKPGVVTLPDGLQYLVITEGKGAKPTKDDTVTVHYIGTLISGKEFDSSYKRGEPATFPVTGVFRAGWKHCNYDRRFNLGIIYPCLTRLRRTRRSSHDWPE